MLDVLTQTLLTAYQAHRHRLDGAMLYLACSGGRDSLSLAYACHLLYQAGQMDRLPILLHVHHGWQSANDDWAKLVETWAIEHGFDYQILPVTLPKNSETHARQARYDTMLSVMNDHDVLMLAHHAHDQAETVLMRLIDGAGVQGLSGMKSWQAKFGHDKQVWLWRAWLELSREQITAFAWHHKLPFVDDLTNTDTAYVRGVLRTQILPLLSTINPKAIANIARSSQLLSQTAAWQDQAVDEYLVQLFHEQNHLPYQAVMAVQAFEQLSSLAQSAVLHRWLQGDEPLPPSQQTTQSVLELMARTDNDHRSQIIWQGAYHRYVICRYDAYLYRYRADVWRLLTVGVQADELPNLQHEHQHELGELTLVVDERLQIILKCQQAITHAQKVEKTTPIIIGKHSYKAKKLAQQLRLPPWLRGHLWQVVVADGGHWLIAPMMVWRLPDGERVTLDNFAPMGRMVYNG